jgi:CBS domain-containing protein
MTTVRDVMTSPVLTVRRTTPLKAVAQLLIENKVSGAPVVDVDGTVLGVVSEADFLFKESGESVVSHRPFARVIGESKTSRRQLDKVHAAYASEAMSAPAITIEPDRPVSEAARLMATHKVNRLPVVKDELLLGIVTRADLLRAFVRSDEELQETISNEVILRLLWLDPSAFGIAVKDGVASISGHVDRLSTAEMIGQAVAAVPGIVDMKSSITWTMDDRKVQPARVDPDLVFPIGPR